MTSKAKSLYSLLFTLALFLSHSLLFAQADPCDYGVEGFNYQAIITDSDGNTVKNRPVKLKFQIQQFSGSELLTIYEESHEFTVADNGVVNLILGQGQRQSNNRFCEIHWEVGPTYLTRLIDLGDGFFEAGQTVFNSVPVAEFAKNAPMTSPWLIEASEEGVTTLFYPQQVIIGDSNNQNVPPLVVLGTDDGPTSPTAEFVRTGTRNNVINFTSEGNVVYDNQLRENDQLKASMGILSPGYFPSSGHTFSIGTKKGLGSEYTNPFTIEFGAPTESFSIDSEGQVFVPFKLYGDQFYSHYSQIDDLDANVVSATVYYGDGSQLTGIDMKNTTDELNNTALGTLAFNENEEGYNNTALGFQALQRNKTGNDNTALGIRTMEYNDSGKRNVAVGGYTLYKNINGNDNTVLGYGTLEFNENGNENTALGRRAMAENRSGDGNTAVGTEALMKNQNSANTSLGYFSGSENVSGTLNTFVGYRANSGGDQAANLKNATAIGAEAIVSENNTIQLGNSQVEHVNTFGTISATAFVGDGSGLYNIDTGVQFDENRNLSATGSFTNIQVSSNDASATAQLWSHSPDNLGYGKDNIAISSVGMDHNSTGFGNVALGNNALQNNEVANENTAIGLYSLSQNREIGLNTAVGAFALMQTEIGAANTAVGHNAMTEFKEGYLNIAMGNGTMQLKHFGHSNVALGGDAMRDGRLGNQNVAIGTRAGMHIGDTEMSLEEFEQTLEMGIPLASGNVAIGDDALTSNREGYGNVSVGVLAAHNLNSGNDNIVIGPVALADVSGDMNNDDGRINEVIAIGTGAMRESNNGSRSIAIGFESMRFYSSTNSHTVQTGSEEDDRYSKSTAVGYMALRGSENSQENTGMWNTAIGYQAQLHMKSGFNNTSVGNETLKENSSGYNNTAMGDWSLRNNTEGKNNAAYGTWTLTNNVSGTWNTAIGHSAMVSNEGGSYNTAIGADALGRNISGDMNIAIGGAAMYSSESARENIAIGLNSLRNITSGTVNTAIGHYALISNTTGEGNTAVGYHALFANQTGFTNVAVGQNSLMNNTEGSGNTALGYLAGEFSQESNNTFIGSYTRTSKNGEISNATAIGAEAIVNQSNTIQLGNSQVELVNTFGTISATAFVGDGSKLTNVRGTLQKDEQNNILAGSEYQNLYTGFNNTGIGENALTQISSGDNNTAFGMDALASNSQGVLNTAVGSRALKSNNGNSNVAVGNETMFSNTTGGGNTAVGTGALVENQTGSNNVALGHSAQYKTTGSNNSSVGTHALKNNEAGSKNTALGYYADVSSPDLVNATAIGAEAVVNSSNMIQLGNENVTLVNTSGIVSATAFVGDASLLTLAQDDTEDTVKTLLSIINDLTERIETLETNSTNTFDFGFGYNDDSNVEDQHYDLETQNMWDNDNTIWDLKLSDVGNTFYLDCGNNASIAVLNTPTQSLAKNISNYNFNDIDSLDDIDSEDLYFYSDTTAISLYYLLDVVLIIKTNNNVDPQSSEGGSNKYYAVNVKYYYLNNNGNAGILNLEAKEIEGTSMDIF